MNFSDFTSSLPIKSIYLDLHEIATAILDEKLHYFSQEQFSVDIYKLAAAYEIRTYDTNMSNINLPSDVFPLEVFGYLNTYSGKAFYLTQYTENLTQRYTVAYHLAYYLLNGENTLDYVHYFYFSATPVDFQEQLCHLLASFLLIPVESIGKLILQYSEKTFPSQISFNSWINYLGNTMGLPAYYAATSLQAVRTLHTFLTESSTGFS